MDSTKEDEFEQNYQRYRSQTDEKGNSVYNQRLSEKRAAAEPNSLIKFGVPDQKFVTTGKGDNKPLQNKPGSDADIQNRRLQFISQE